MNSYKCYYCMSAGFREGLFLPGIPRRSSDHVGVLLKLKIMSNRTVIIIASILVAFGVVVYFMHDASAKSSALLWFGIMAFVVTFGLVVNYIRKKRGSE